VREQAGDLEACRALQPGCRSVCSYASFVGVTGAASFLSWKPGWEDDNVQITHMSDDAAAPFANAFRAIGDAHEHVGSGPGRAGGGGRQRACRARLVLAVLVVVAPQVLESAGDTLWGDDGAYSQDPGGFGEAVRRAKRAVRPASLRFDDGDLLGRAVDGAGARHRARGYPWAG
jgi:hypothetical protein